MSLAGSASSSLSNIAGLFSGRSTPTMPKGKKLKGEQQEDAPARFPIPGTSGVVPAEDDIQVDQDWQSGLGEHDYGVDNRDIDETGLSDRKFRATNNDPVGHILIQLLGECADQAKRNKQSMSFGVDDLCTLFYNHKLHEKHRLGHRIKQANVEWEEEMIERELNSHTLNQTVEPPTVFSPVPTLESNKQLAEVMRLVPGAGHKFSGTPGKMSVLEYLFSLNMMQKQCMLSKPEFLQMMLASTTGKPHIYLMRRIQERDELSNIYHNLLLHYDKRIEPEEARAKLHSYKAPKSANLAEIEVHIQELAGLTTSALPEGTARNTAYNYEQVQALIKCLPPQSSIMVRNLYNQLSTKLKKPAQAGQLSRLLNNYRYTIDQDIKQHGGEDRKYTDSRRFSSGPKPVSKFTRKYTSYSIQGGAPPEQNPGSMQTSRPHNASGYNGNRSGFNRMASPGQYKPTFSRPSNNSNANRTGSTRPTSFNGRQSGFGSRGNTRDKNPRFGNNRFGSNGSRDYCSLCGRRDHKAVDGCRYMVTDSGRQVKVMPTKDTCTACPSHVQPPLSHPVHLCPYRAPKGPLYGK